MRGGGGGGGRSDEGRRREWGRGIYLRHVDTETSMDSRALNTHQNPKIDTEEEESHLIARSTSKTLVEGAEQPNLTFLVHTSRTLQHS